MLLNPTKAALSFLLIAIAVATLGCVEETPSTQAPGIESPPSSAESEASPRELCSNSEYSTTFDYVNPKYIMLDYNSLQKLRDAIEKEGDSALWGISDLNCIERFYLNLPSGPVTEGPDVSHLISDISAFSKLTNMKNLRLAGMSVSDISVLQNMKTLWKVNICDAPVSDISPLKNLSSLEFAYLSRTNISDLSPLENLPKIKLIYLEGSNVEDISPLAGLSTLEVLNIANTKVIDISPLLNLKNLKTVYLWQTSVSESDVNALNARILENNGGS